jgi:hypothetical protein
MMDMNAAQAYRGFLGDNGLSEFDVWQRLKAFGVPGWLIAKLPSGESFPWLSSTLDQIARESKMHGAFGPVHLIYGSRPLGEPGFGKIVSEDFANTDAALCRVRELWVRTDFHNLRITDQQDKTIWWESDLMERLTLMR